MGEYAVITTFSGFIRRPEPLITGMKARLFGENGDNADNILELGKTKYHDALVDVTLKQSGIEIGGFQGYVRRPKPLESGNIAMFFAENGEMADAITAMSLSKYLDIPVDVEVRLMQDANGQDKAKKGKGPYGKEAQTLWRSSFFRSKAVWVAVGTDEDLKKWIWTQDCCVKKEFGSHDGDIIAAHVERVGTGSGTAIKSEYAMVPMCNKHHQIQHNSGESAVGGREFFDEQRIRYLQKWCWSAVPESLGYDGISYIPPNVLLDWATENGIDKLLPWGYKL